MARDDDMDYPILGLLALEGHGSDLTSRNMANTWLSRMPFYLLYTAESAAYRNLVNRRWPPESATWRNPFREWIGAQIRADIFGYVSPGWPERAAELAFRDACMSHVKNGIYGEMFVAAMLAATFATSDIDEIVDVGLSEIPANCRLAEAVRETRAWCHASADWEEVWDRINERFGHYHRVHTINNAALVVMGLYFGARDYGNGIVVHRPRRLGHRLQRGHRRLDSRCSVGRRRTAAEMDRRSRRPAPLLRARLQRQPHLRASGTYAPCGDGHDRRDLVTARLLTTPTASPLWYKAARSNAARSLSPAAINPPGPTTSLRVVATRLRVGTDSTPGPRWPTQPTRKSHGSNQHARHAGRRCSLRPPDALLEPENVVAHFRCPQQDPHHQPRGDRTGPRRSLGRGAASRRQAQQDPLRRDQARRLKGRS